MRKAAIILFILISFLLNAEENKSAVQSAPMEADQKTVVVTLEEAVEMALSHSRDLKSSRIDYEQAERVSSHSWNDLLPTLSLGAGVNTAGDTDSFSAGENPFNTEYSASLSFSLSPSIRETMKQKSLSLDMQEIAFEQSSDAVRNSAEKLFYYLLASEKNIEIKEKAYSLAEKQYRQTEVNFRNGLASELQLLQSRINAENQKPGISSAKLDFENNMISFKDLLSIDKNKDVELSGNLEIEPLELDADVIVEKYLRKLPAVKSSEITVSYNESLVRGIRKTINLPVFSASAAYTNTLNDLTGNYPETSINAANSGEWTDSAAVTLALSWSPDFMLGGSAEKDSIKSTEEGLEQARLSHADLIQTKEKQIITSVIGITAYENNLNVSKLNRELAERSYQMTEDSFKNGTAESLEVDEARQEWETAELNYLTSLYSYRSEVLDLAYLLNTDIETLRRSGK